MTRNENEKTIKVDGKKTKKKIAKKRNVHNLFDFGKIHEWKKKISILMH